MKGAESEKYITSKDKMKTKQNTSVGRTMEVTTTSEQHLILGVVAGGIGLPQTFQDDVLLP
jgi:acyl CoA:acetate/3-ketoacid CoA transferase alpha subunit